MEESTQVYLAVYSHKHGKDFRVCEDEKTAHEVVLSLAEENFSEFDDEVADSGLTGEVQKCIKENDAPGVIERWTDFSGLLEYFEIEGPIPVETTEQVKRERVQMQYPWNIQQGDDVKWTDPDEGRVAIFTVVEVDYHGEKGDDDCVITLHHATGTLQCFAHELS